MPHSWILDCLDLYKINRTLRAFIRSSMGMCRTALEANLRDLTKKLWTPQAHAASDSSWTVYFTGCQTHSNTFFAAAQPQSFLEVSLTALSLHAHTSSLVLSVTTRREAGTAPWAHSPTPPPQRSQRPDPCHTPPLPDWSRGYIRLNLHPPLSKFSRDNLPSTALLSGPGRTEFHGAWTFFPVFFSKVEHPLRLPAEQQLKGIKSRGGLGHLQPCKQQRI